MRASQGDEFQRKSANLTRAAGRASDLGQVEVRTCKYLNNIVEQDHRAIKRRCASMAGFKSFENASIALSGIELAHRIRKRQFSFGRGRPPRRSMRAMWAIVMG